MSRRTRTGPPDHPVDAWLDPAAQDDDLDDLDDPFAESSADPADGSDTDDDPSRAASDEARERPKPSLQGLSVGGFSRRRVAWLIAAALTAWIVVVFARQVGEASVKATEANQARVANAQLTQDVAALQRELDLIQRPAFIEQQAHALGLGSAKDHAFTLAQDAPPLPSDAPGSAAVRLGAHPTQMSPLDSWLDLLFGPPPGN
ncbi:MAG TPA: hypothetical protein VK656_04210 [Candidatus Acidoferrum sp.]|nr:hypothetical protein [Candidatus Acidoferrum sp.]